MRRKTPIFRSIPHGKWGRGKQSDKKTVSENPLSAVGYGRFGVTWDLFQQLPALVGMRGTITAGAKRPVLSPHAEKPINFTPTIAGTNPA
jgi:hypothetical protein